MRTRTALLLLLALLPGARAAAQSVPSPIRYIAETQAVNVYGGYLFTTPGIAISDSVTVDFGPQDAPVFGARYQVRVGGPFNVEAGLAYSPARRKVFAAARAPADTTQITPDDTGLTTAAQIMMLDLGLRFSFTGPRTWHGLAPYAVLQGGFVTDLGGVRAEEKDIPERERFDFGPSFAVGAHLGTDFYPSRTVSIRLELQNRLWRMESPEGFFPRGRVPESEWNATTGVVAGASIHF